MRQKRTFTIDEMTIIETRLMNGVGIYAIAKELHCDDKLVSKYIKETFGVDRMPKAGRRKDPNKKPKVSHSPIGGTVNKVTNVTSGECIIPADTYSDIPSDLKAASYDEDGELMHELVVTMKEKRSMYPHFVSHMVEEKDYFERNGIVGHTHFDILVQGMKVVIVNVKDKEEQANWKKKTHVDGFRLTEYLNRNGIYTIIYNYNGVEGILKELEELAKWKANHHFN